MKILYLSFDPGIPYGGTKGSSIHIREFTKALRQAGHQVTTVVARLGAAAPKAGQVYKLPRVEADFFRPEAAWGSPALLAEAKAFAQNFAAKKLLKKLPAAHFDFIYERYSLFGIAGLAWAREQQLPFLLEVNSPLLREAKTHRQLVLEPVARAVEQYLFSQADHIIAVSLAMKEYIGSVAPEARHRRVTIVPNGVDVKPFLRPGSSVGAKAKREKGEFRVGFVGSLKPWHGLEFLLEAFCRLPAREKLKLVIIGEGPLRHQLEKEAGKLGLQDRVMFTGAVRFEQIPRTLKSLDAFVAPYPQIDGFYFSPLKIFEYMAAGRPIVASRIGQVAEILHDGKNALLVPPEDPAALVSALRRLKADRKLGARLGREAQRAALREHTWQVRLATLEPVFHSLAAKR